MKEKEIFQYIKDTDNVPPFESAPYEDWINAEDVIRFLKSTKELGLIPTQIYSIKFFMYSLFIPKVRFENMNPEYFMNRSLQTKEQCFSFSLWSSAGKGRFCQIRGANVIEDNLTKEDAIFRTNILEVF